MSLSDFDKQTVALVPDRLIIPERIALPQYQVKEAMVLLEYRNEGNSMSKEITVSLILL